MTTNNEKAVVAPKKVAKTLFKPAFGVLVDGSNPDDGYTGPGSTVKKAITPKPGI